MKFKELFFMKNEVLMLIVILNFCSISTMVFFNRYQKQKLSSFYKVNYKTKYYVLEPIRKVFRL